MVKIRDATIQSYRNGVSHYLTRGGGGLTSIIKVYTDVRLEGIYFSGLQVHFHIKIISTGYLFTQKVYEWVNFEK